MPKILYLKIPDALFKQLVERAKKFDISTKEYIVAAIEEAVEANVGTDPSEPAPGE